MLVYFIEECIASRKGDSFHFLLTMSGINYQDYDTSSGLNIHGFDN